MTSTTLKSKSEIKIKKERKPRTTKSKVEGEKSTTKKIGSFKELEKTIEKIENHTATPDTTKPTKIQKLILLLRRFFDDDKKIKNNK
jgi:hypothetical protein